MKKFSYSIILALSIMPAVARAQGQVPIRIGLAYDPDPARTVAVLPAKGGPYGDSLAAIVERDLKYSDRMSTLPLNPRDAGVFYDSFRNVSYDFFSGLNATYVVEMTATQTSVNVRLHDIAKRSARAAMSFALPTSGLSRDWRMAVHTLSDSLVAIVTNGPRGVAATRIAYARGQTLRVVDSDGANDVAVPADSNAISPSWDPTGTRLVYNTYGTDPRIMIVDVASGQSTIVQRKTLNTTVATPVFYPDGRSIVFARRENDNFSTLWRIPLGGGTPEQIDKQRAISSSPSFSPDGRRLTFMTDRLGHNEIYIMDLDGSNATWITQIAGDLNESSYRAEPDWSSDGVTIAFQSRVSGNFQIMTVNLRDNYATLLTNAGENQSPSWAPDGRHLVFTSSRSGSDQLWIMDTRSSVTRQLTYQSGAKYGAWSPRLTIRP